MKKIVFPNYNDNATTKFCTENVRVAYANQCRLMRSICGNRYFKIDCYELLFGLITHTHWIRVWVKTVYDRRVSTKTTSEPNDNALKRFRVDFLRLFSGKPKIGRCTSHRCHEYSMPRTDDEIAVFLNTRHDRLFDIHRRYRWFFVGPVVRIVRRPINIFDGTRSKYRTKTRSRGDFLR